VGFLDEEGPIAKHPRIEIFYQSAGAAPRLKGEKHAEHPFVNIIKGINEDKAQYSRRKTARGVQVQRAVGKKDPDNALSGLRTDGSNPAGVANAKKSPKRYTLPEE